MQRQTQQTASASLPTQGQKSQPQLPGRQLISQAQPEKTQQQPNPSQQDTLQKLQTSGTLNPTSEKRFANIGDWQEEVYQKAKSLKSEYFKDLNVLWNAITNRLKQHDSVPQQPSTVQLKRCKLQLGQTLSFLNEPKCKITPAYAENLNEIEKKIISICSATTRKSIPSPRQGILPDKHSLQQLLQPQSQTPQVHGSEDQKEPQLQSANLQSSLRAKQQNNEINLQHGLKSSLSEPSTTQQNMMHLREHFRSSDSKRENSVKSMQKVAMGSLQNPMSTPQLPNVSTLFSRSQVNGTQSNVNPIELSANTLQHMHLKKTRGYLDVPTQKHTQKFEKHKIQQKSVQQNRQKWKQQAEKLWAHETQQHQMNEVNDMEVRLGTVVKTPQHQVNSANNSKVRRGMVVKPGLILQHQSGGQSSVYKSQHSKSGASFPISSPKHFQLASPRLPQHSPQNLSTPLTEAGIPICSADSTSVIASSSTSLAQSSMPRNCEILISDASSLLNAGNIGHQRGPGSLEAGKLLVISTPGISASPLLEESNNLDDVSCKTSTIIFGESSVAEQPLQRLVKVVNLISPKALSASVSDIGSVMCMTDGMSSSAPDNGSRAEIGEDLVAMTKSHLQARYVTRWNDSSGTRKMKRCTSALVLSSTNVSINDNFRKWIDVEESDLESTITSSIKRPRIEAKHALLEEIREINQQLIDTVVIISDEETFPTAAVPATDSGEGIIVKCSYSAVAIGPNFKSQQASAEMSPIQPLRLIVPTNYPYRSPILLDKMPVEAREDYDDLSVKVKSKLNVSLRSLLEPFSLGEIARMWDFCARAVICEYAEQNGGGNFSSKYGTWENCLSAA